MHVGVGDGGDADAGLLGGELERAPVPRRVHDQGVRPVVDQVCVVPQLRDLDDDDLHERSSLSKVD